MAPDFNIGDLVENAARGIAPRKVWGVRRSPDGTFLQFAAGAEWMLADGFTPVGAAAGAAVQPAAPTAMPTSLEPDLGFEE